MSKLFTWVWVWSKLSKQYFYLENSSLVAADTVRLKKQDAHHLIKVWRKNIGDKVFAKTFDRRELEMKIESIELDQVQLKIIKERAIPIKEKRKTYCFVAIPKLNTLAALLPKLSELNATGCIPVITGRSFLQKRTLWNRQRFQRIVRESFKQCGRDVPMDLYDPVPIEELASLSADLGPFAAMDLLVPWEGEAKKHILASKITRSKVGYFIGPEGGLTPSEVHLLKGFGFKPVSLGETVLKVENAVIATIIYLRALDFFGPSPVDRST